MEADNRPSGRKRLLCSAQGRASRDGEARPGRAGRLPERRPVAAAAGSRRSGNGCSARPWAARRLTHTRARPVPRGRPVRSPIRPCASSGTMATRLTRTPSRSTSRPLSRSTSRSTSRASWTPSWRSGRSQSAVGRTPKRLKDCREGGPKGGPRFSRNRKRL